jgi:hypothetical protein
MEMSTRTVYYRAAGARPAWTSNDKDISMKTLAALSAALVAPVSLTAHAGTLPYPRSSSQLAQGSSLAAGQNITSKNGRYRLAMQTDGNVVVYDAPTSRPLWDSRTAGSGGSSLHHCLRYNGDMAPYTAELCVDSSTRTVWQTSNQLGKVYPENFYTFTTVLDMQDDGNLVLSDIVSRWQSNSFGGTQCSGLLLFPSGTRIYRGASYPVCGGYSLDFRTDGNLVVTLNGATLWSSNTAGRGAEYAAMQSDGNFVLYTASASPLWSTGTYGKPNSYLVFQGDGNLIVFQQHPIWDSWGKAH